MDNHKIELIQTDIEFTKDSQKRGIDAWVDRFLEKGVMVNNSGDIVQGKLALKSCLAPLFELKDLKFIWHPIQSGVSDDGTLGYTYGDYIRKYINAEGQLTTVTGRYTTIWRKQADGQWKIELDIGN